jgi:hypothetical protein
MAAGMVGVQNLRELFESRVYTIDYYQREYSWPESDVRRLVNDLWSEFSKTWNPAAGRRRQLEVEPYFLGAFVYHEETDRTRFLVDGQQRFTTLHLMFIILHRLAVEYSEHSTARALNAMIEHHPPGSGAQFRIRIHADERERPLRALYENNQRYRLPPSPSLSLRNLWDRGQQLDALLRDRLHDTALPYFVDWIRDRVVMAPIRAVNRAHGFKIFETMNDRGARLTSVDLVKSFLLSSAGDRQDELNDAWRQMLNRLGSARQDPDVPKRFLRDVLVAQHAHLEGAKPEIEEINGNPNAWVRENTDRLRLQNEDDYAAFINNLTAMAGYYQTFLSAAEAPRAEFKLQSIYYNAVNGLECQYPLLLAAIGPGDDLGSVRAKARLLANYIDRRYVLRSIEGDHVDDPHLFEELSPLIPTLRTCVDVTDVGKALHDAIAGEDDPFMDLEAFAFRRSNADQVLYLLARLMSYVEEQTGKPHDIRDYLQGSGRTPQRWQIEHLWPVTFDPSTQNLDSRHFEKLRNQIGALVLLPASDNASLSDLPYGEKIKRYGRQPNLVAILNPDHRRNYTPQRRFIESHGLEKTFRSFGPNPNVVETVRERCKLYTALSERIWDPASLGFGQKPAAVPDAAPRVTEIEPRAGRQPTARKTRSAGGNTVLAKMVKAGVIQIGQPLFTSYNGTSYEARVTSRGLIELFPGVTRSSPDTALQEITGGRATRKGMDLWQVEVDGKRISLNELRTRAETNGVKLR